MAKRSFQSTALPPSAMYSSAVIVRGLAYVSGIGPTDPATGAHIRGDFDAQVHRSMRNLAIVLDEMRVAMSDVVKVNAYLSDIADFARFNELYAAYFAPPMPARTTIQAGALPGGIAFEIEVVVDMGDEA